MKARAAGRGAGPRCSAGPLQPFRAAPGACGPAGRGGPAGVTLGAPASLALGGPPYYPIIDSAGPGLAAETRARPAPARARPSGCLAHAPGMRAAPVGAVGRFWECLPGAG